MFYLKRIIIFAFRRLKRAFFTIKTSLSHAKRFAFQLSKQVGYRTHHILITFYCSTLRGEEQEYFGTTR